MSEDIQVHGYCEDNFTPVKEAFAENFKQGMECGASFAATIDGEFVVDIWGGYADEAKTRLWERDTIVNVWSSTKVMTTICALMLVDRKRLDLDSPVAKYWPEFAQNGKEAISVRYLFSHSSGLAGFSETVTPGNLYDWQYIVEMLATQEPLWEPGTQSGYHGLTMGYLLGELVKRITRKTIGTFFRDEIAVPLDADFFIGLPEEYDSRVAEMIPPPPVKPGDSGYEELDPDTIRGKVRLNQPLDHTVVNTPGWRRAEIPAANGHGNAHAMARIGAVMACGGELDGIRFLTMETINRMIEEQTNGIDLVLNTLIRWGLGVELNTPERPLSPNERSFSWGGAGGSMMVMDLDARMSWAYVMNKMGNGPHFLEPRNRRLSEALYDVLTKRR
ncbi:MAG: beta-lactamase family protein [Dehalococcoidales bacterium]|nr:MAG: beta-lactamase family protein [Dehalococcoidales bacterium]